MGEIGISRDDFLHVLKLWEIQSIIRGYRKRQLEDWKTTRWHAWTIARMLGAKDLSTPQDILPLPGDDDATEAISDEEIADLQEQIRRENEKMAAQ